MGQHLMKQGSKSCLNDDPEALDKVFQILEAVGGEEVFPSLENSEIVDTLCLRLKPILLPEIPDRIVEPLYHIITEQATASNDTPGIGTSLAICVKKIGLPQDIPTSWVDALNNVPKCNSYEDYCEYLIRTSFATMLRKLGFDQELPNMIMILTRLMQISSTEQKVQVLCSAFGVESMLKTAVFVKEVIGIRPSALALFEIDYSKFTPLVESVGVKEETVYFLIDLLGLNVVAARPRQKEIRSIPSSQLARQWKQKLDILRAILTLHWINFRAYCLTRAKSALMLWAIGWIMVVFAVFMSSIICPFI